MDLIGGSLPTLNSREGKDYVLFLLFFFFGFSALSFGNPCLFPLLSFFFFFYPFLFFFRLSPIPDVPFLPPPCVVPGLSSSLGRLRAEPDSWAERSPPRICRIPLAFTAAPRSTCRSLLPQPRPTAINGRGCPSTYVSPCAFLRLPAGPYEFRMGLRVGAMQASRR